MARDGTQRGGVRVGAGKKRKSLDDKILEGTADFTEKNSNKTAANKIKSPKKYLTADQKTGQKFYARQIYKETWEWIQSCGCEEIIPKQLVENYAQVSARHIQAEEFLSQYGLLTKHPTTGEPIISPFVKISLDYIKQSQQSWYQIYQAVRDNSTGVTTGGSQDDTMERLLRRVK